MVSFHPGQTSHQAASLVGPDAKAVRGLAAEGGKSVLPTSDAFAAILSRTLAEMRDGRARGPIDASAGVGNDDQVSQNVGRGASRSIDAAENRSASESTEGGSSDTPVDRYFAGTQGQADSADGKRDEFGRPSLVSEVPGPSSVDRAVGLAGLPETKGELTDSTMRSAAPVANADGAENTSLANSPRPPEGGAIGQAAEPREADSRGRSGAHDPDASLPAASVAGSGQVSRSEPSGATLRPDGRPLPIAEKSPAGSSATPVDHAVRDGVGMPDETRTTAAFGPVVGGGGMVSAPLSESPTAVAKTDGGKFAPLGEPGTLEANLRASAPMPAQASTAANASQPADATRPFGTNGPDRMTPSAVAQPFPAEGGGPEGRSPTSAEPDHAQAATGARNKDAKAAIGPSRYPLAAPAVQLASPGPQLVPGGQIPPDAGRAIGESDLVDRSDTIRFASGATPVETALIGRSGPTGLPGQADLPRQVAQQLVAALRGTADMASELRLSPSELGRVRISLSSSDAGMVVSIVAERPETLDLMRRHVDQLAQEFHDIGYPSAEFSFGQSASDQSRGDGRQEDRPDTGTPAALHEVTDTRQTPHKASGIALDRVDVRV